MVHQFGLNSNILTALGWILVEVSTIIHGARRMDLRDFGDPLVKHHHEVDSLGFNEISW